MIVLALLQQGQFGVEFAQHLRTMRAFAFRLVRIEAEDVAFAPLAIADPDLLDLQVVGHLLVAARPGQHFDLDVLHLAHRHGQDVAPKSAAECGKVVGRVHPGIADEQAAAEPPGAQIILDAGHRGDIGGIAGQHPGAHRHAVAGDGERDDHLRLVVAALLAVAAPTQRSVEPAGEHSCSFSSGSSISK